eukprot:TRINITY_DN7101_c0_g5_i2.p1 TRINITY_DN7101_c0_g5~~TRINITY_DN7101_c0_g5_i2.p1  ORF type:complete len:379 (+),score=110.58 TRINITY_DN7101_c0_g5_i2:1234-2370(+)
MLKILLPALTVLWCAFLIAQKGEGITTSSTTSTSSSPSQSQSHSLPILDLSKGITDENAKVLSNAFSDVGFLYLTGHGIPQQVFDDLESSSRAFFKLPESRKSEIDMKFGGKAWRGWFPMNGELTAGRPDHKEGIYFGREEEGDHSLPLHGRNLFLNTTENDTDELIAFQDRVLNYMNAMESLAIRLMQLVGKALAFDVQERIGDKPTVLFRIFNYMVDEWKESENEYGVQQHTDYGILTLLRQDGQGGLEVKHRKKGWIAAPPMKDDDGVDMIVVNIGDMLERWSKGWFRSTLHRVRNKGTANRISFPFFFDPCWECTIDALPVQVPKEHLNSARYQRWDDLDMESLDGKSYGEFLLSKVSKVFPNLINDVGIEITK